MEQSDIVEKAQDSLKKLASTGIGMSLTAWDEVSNNLLECTTEITRLRAALAEALIKAYDVGFANSGEGYNGEYGADVLSDYYIQTRAEAIALINNQSNGENNAKS